MAHTYHITLQNCAFFARHGVLEEEETLGQRFFVDAELEVSAGEAFLRDEIGDTVHYGEAFHLIQSVMMGERRRLIEALASDIAQKLCNRFPQIVRAKITVRKPSAPVPGILDFVQVTVEHFA